MNSELVKRNIFVVIYPYKFTEFNYKLFELEYIKKYCDLRILDVSAFTSPKYSQSLSVQSFANKEVEIISSFREFILLLKELRKESHYINICILNELRYSTIWEALCNLAIGLLLKKKNIIIFDLYNGGVPLEYIDSNKNNKSPSKNISLIQKIVSFIRLAPTFTQILFTFRNYILFSLFRLISQPITHRLVAGEIWFKKATDKKSGNNSIKIVFGHSYDYSNYLMHHLTLTTLSEKNNKIGILLDGAGPFYKSDELVLGSKIYLTVEKWYPALIRFFDALELETHTKIEIAGHYKSNHSSISSIFGNRSVYYGKTLELVYRSQFVITRMSTAISYAVIFRKPIIFIYSNQLKEDFFAMKNIFELAGLIGNEPVNIDEIPDNINGLLTVDEERYLNYEKSFLTSDITRRPNAQIILEDMMGINTHAYFDKLNQNS